MCGEHPYLILDADEACPVGAHVDELPSIVDALKDEGYLQVKYADKSEYCLGVTNQGRALVNEVRAERERRKQAVEDAAKAEASRKEAERKEREAQEAAEKEKKKLEEALENAKRELEEAKAKTNETPSRKRSDDAKQAKSRKEKAKEAHAPAAIDAVDVPAKETDPMGHVPEVKREEKVPVQSEKKDVGVVSVKEGRIVLLVWLAAFLGALLGGGIVGLVMYILHVVLK